MLLSDKLLGMPKLRRDCERYKARDDDLILVFNLVLLHHLYTERSLEVAWKRSEATETSTQRILQSDSSTNPQNW